MNKKEYPYNILIENIDNGCWKDKTGEYFIESFTEINKSLEYFDKVQDNCKKIMHELHNSSKKDKINNLLKGLK